VNIIQALGDGAATAGKGQRNHGGCESDYEPLVSTFGSKRLADPLLPLLTEACD